MIDAARENTMPKTGTRRGAENIIAQFPEGVSRNVDDYVDASILDGLKREGFFAGLEQKYGER
jgi:hypothetical protein